MSLNALGSDLPRSGQTAGQLPMGSRWLRSTTPDEESRVEDGIILVGDNGATRALDALSKFIPTEMLAPYVAALSLAATQGWNATQVYWYFVVATPLVFILLTFSKDAIDRRPWPYLPPLAWRTIAATIAFAVWGLSVPTNPLQATIGGAAVAGFFGLVVSPLLSASDAIALRLIGSPQRMRKKNKP